MPMPRHLVAMLAAVPLADPTAIAGGPTTGDAVNFARDRLATGTSVTGTASARFAADGRAGPRNRWVSADRGRNRLNIFLEEPIQLGSLHLYSFAYDRPPVTGFQVHAADPVTGQLAPIPGAVVSGNTDEAVRVIFATPVTTRQVEIRFDDAIVSVDEVALFPPDGPDGFPLGTDVNLHQARQHRLALTPTSSRLTGSLGRSAVDGFIGEARVWATSGIGPHWIELDIADPPETTPPDVRVATTPVRIGAAHIYSGTDAGGRIVAAGRFQHFVAGAGAGWVDIPGSAFAGNTSPFLAIAFDEVVVTDRLRLFIDDAPSVAVREVVPLPPIVGGVMWPEGTSVVDADPTDFADLADHFYSLGVGAVELASDGSGGVAAAPASGVIGQQYHVLANLGTDTVRIVSRLSGLALAVEGASTDAGAPIVEAPYAALPHQRWRRVPGPDGDRFINARSGLAMTLNDATPGAGLAQRPEDPADPLQSLRLTRRTHAGKKGNGGFPDLAGTARADWAYNWGKDDTYPAEVTYWPMQWGSFNWDQWPELAPAWRRAAEPLVLMGYNEPDGADQSDIPVDIGIRMWPRLEVQDLPLLGPAPVNPTNAWITSFMQGVEQQELRVDLIAVHAYGGPDATSFINALADARQTFGNRDVVVSEFSVVDWNNTNSWNDDDVFAWFAEVFWRMEKLDWLRRYAVFVFTDDPADQISDNRGELRNADGSLTPEGLLYAAWDGDTTIRPDTPYHLHNQGSARRPGSVTGATGVDALAVGTRHDVAAPFRWHLVPAGAPGEYRIASTDDGRVMSIGGRGMALVEPGPADPGAVFRLVESQHGWFFIEDVLLGRRLSSDSAGGELEIASPGTTGAGVLWRFVPVFGGVPAAPRDLGASSLGDGLVELTWAPHGFRDLVGMRIHRTDAAGHRVLVGERIGGATFFDRVPLAGGYVYDVVAEGDTGSSTPAAVAVSADTCPADFDGSFTADAADVEAVVLAVGAGLDLNASGTADLFDVIDFLRTFDAGCP